MKEPIFKDERLQEQFDRDGVVKFKFLNDSQIKALRQFYEEGMRKRHEAAIYERSLHSTSEIFDPEIVTQVDKFIQQVMGEPAERILQNYQTLMGSYLVKPGGSDTELRPHQDLLFVDEPDYCSFNLWVPLQDTGPKTGHIKALKGSHLITPTLRVLPTYPWPFLDFQKSMVPYLSDIYTQLGECVAINHAVIHGSDVNLSPNPRVAASLSVCSSGSDVHYHYWPIGAANDKIEKYKMTGEDYRYIEKTGKPGRGEFVGYVSHAFNKVDEKLYKDWMDKHYGNSLWSKMKSVFKLSA